MKRLALLAIAALWLAVPSHSQAQSLTRLCFPATGLTATRTSCINVDANNPLPTTATLSAAGGINVTVTNTTAGPVFVSNPNGFGGGSVGGGPFNVTITNVADGVDATLGAIADAAATAGSTGTLSAKLRLMTTQLDTINTTLGANVTNPNSPPAWGIGAYAAALPANGNAIGGRGSSAEPTAVTDGQTVAPQLSLGGKTITLPYSVKELAVRGTADSTDGAAHTILAAASGSNKTYITDIECGNTSATGVTVTFNDTVSTKLPVPPNFGGNNKTFHIPLVTAAATAFQFTASTGVTTITCNAQGYTGL